MRAQEARVPSDRTSSFLIKYLQVSYAVGVIGMGHSIFEILRCLLINATKGTYTSSPNTGSTDVMELQPSTEGNLAMNENKALDVQQSVANDVEENVLAATSSTSLFIRTARDDINGRRRIQRICGVVRIPFFIAIILGVDITIIKQEQCLIRPDQFNT